MHKMKLNQRSVGIIIAVILGCAAMIYLGGLLGQINENYQLWLSQDGLTGSAKMTPVNFSPLYCFPYSFTKSGLRGVLLILGLTAAGLTLAKLYGRFGSKDYDPRNFRRSANGTYGTAGWMNDKEMRSVLELSSPGDAKGVILGQKNGKVICLPEDTRLNKHILVYGATGTMKSRGVIRPYLFQALKRGESVVITDPKTELYTDTAEMFRQNGYEVKVFNLVDPSHGDSWNCMADLAGDTLMAQVLTDVIIKNTSEGRGDHFWDNGEGNLLKALVLYVDQDNSRGLDAKNLPAVYQMLTQYSERQLTAMFNKLPIEHPARGPFNLYSQSSDTVRAGIVLGLGTRLQILQNESVRKITSSSEIDLTQPGKKKCAYYIILSDQEGALDFLSTLFFSFLFIKLVRYADSTPERRCKIPVNIVLDEANNIGTLPDYPRRLSTIRSRSLQVVMAVQNLAQLQNRYPNNEWAEIVGNFDTQLMLGCTDELTAELFSLRSGDMTVEVNSTMTVRRTIAVAQLIPQYRHTEGQGKRRLLTPDEVLRIPNDELLVVIRGQKMLRANKFDFTGHPYAKKMVETPISDYLPKREPTVIHPQTDPAPPEQPANKRPSPNLFGAAKPPDEF